MLPVAALSAQATQAPALAEAARAVEAGRDALRGEARPSPEQLANLRVALEKALKTRAGALGRFHPGTLEAAGLWGAALHRTGEAERGDRVWVRACTELQRGLKHQERFHGRESRQLLPFLEALEACFAAQGLNPRPYAERLLAIAIATTKAPSADLERRTVAALTHHYGGEFLSMRGPDIGRTLGWCEALANLWLRRPGGPEQTRAFLETAFRGDAQGVWGLAAKHGGEALKGQVATLLARVDAAVLAEDPGWAGIWAQPLLATPWKDLAQTTLARVDRHLAAQPGLDAKLRRGNLARAEGAWARGAALLAEALEEADAAQFPLAVARSLDFLERHPDARLRRSLARMVSTRLPALGPEGAELARGLAQVLEDDGAWLEAEALRRRVLRPESAGDKLLLARNLEGQGRWEEAADLFATVAAVPAEDAPDAVFEWIRALRRAGRIEEARPRAREALDAWAAGPLALPRRGLADALALVMDGPPPPDRAVLLGRLHRELGLPEDWPTLALPALVATLEAEEAARAGAVRRPCDPGDAAQPGEARALALLAEVAVRDDGDRVDCLDLALKLLEEAWEPRDPRLVPLLQRVAEQRRDRAPDKAEAALRRAQAILEAAERPSAEALLEVRTLLGTHLLRQGRPEAGQRILQDAFDRAVPAFRSTPREMDAAGGLILALLQGFEERLEYDRALRLAQRAAAVVEALPAFPDDARQDLAALLKTLEHQAKLQGLMGAAWPEPE